MSRLTAPTRRRWLAISCAVLALVWARVQALQPTLNDRSQAVRDPLFCAALFSDDGDSWKTVRQAIVTVADAGETERVVEVLNMLVRTSRTGRIYEPVRDLWRQGKWSLAVELAVGIDDKTAREHLLRDFTKWAVFGDDLPRKDDALTPAKLFESIGKVKNSDIRDDLFDHVAAAFADAGHFDSSLQAAKRITGLETKTSALTWLAHDLATAGEQQRAQRVLQRALATAQKLSDKTSRHQRLAAIAPNFVDAGQYAKARQIANAIADEESRIPVLTAIAQRLYENGKKQLAHQTLHSAITLAGQADTPEIRSAFFLTTAEGALKLNAPTLARDLLSRAHTAAQGVQDPRSRSWAITLIALSFAEMDDSRRATELAAAIAGEPGEAMVLRAVSHSLVKSGKAQQALQIANRIDNEFYRNEALTEIVAQLAAANQLDCAATVARTINNELYRGEAEAAIVRHFLKQGKFDKALAYAKLIEDDITRTDSLIELARHWLRQGKTETAVKVANAASSAAARDEVFSVLARDSAGKSDFEHAVQLASKISSADNRDLILTMVATRLAETGSYARASEVASEVALQVNRWDAEVALITMAADHDKKELARQLVGRLHATAQNLSDSADLKPVLLIQLAQAYCAIGDHEKASRHVSQSLARLGGQPMAARAAIVEILARTAAVCATAKLQLSEADLAALRTVVDKLSPIEARRP